MPIAFFLGEKFLDGREDDAAGSNPQHLPQIGAAIGLDRPLP